MSRRTIAIIGGGPAGATTAETLARGWGLADQGHSRTRVLVFEDRPGWEKPCGGGLSNKALRRYPFLAQATSGGRLIREAELAGGGGAAVRFTLTAPMAIYSRATLDRLLLQRAEDAGAEVVPDRILCLRRRETGWELIGRQEKYRADYVVLAAGARTRLRQTLVDDFLPRDLMLTFGYYLPLESELLRVQFYEKYEGYAWSFPRTDHLSVGICAKVGEEPMAAMRERLRDFMEKSGYAPDPDRVFSHVLPSLSVEGWAGLRLGGPGWALVGDAAGLVDPVTGEGIYYALRSGELAAEALVEDLPEAYPERVRGEFGRSLAMGARLARWFYYGEFLGGGITTRMIKFGAQSRRFLAIVQRLIEGSQAYPELIVRLYGGLAGTVPEAVWGRLRDKWELSAAGSLTMTGR